MPHPVTLCGISGKAIELDRCLTYAGRAGQPGGKGWVRLSPGGVQEGQEVDPAQPPVPNPQRGRRVRHESAGFVDSGKLADLAMISGTAD